MYNYFKYLIIEGGCCVCMQFIIFYLEALGPLKMNLLKDTFYPFIFVTILSKTFFHIHQCFEPNIKSLSIFRIGYFVCLRYFETCSLRSRLGVKDCFVAIYAHFIQKTGRIYKLLPTAVGSVPFIKVWIRRSNYVTRGELQNFR